MPTGTLRLSLHLDSEAHLQRRDAWFRPQHGSP
jgi:hypothetical protein